MSSHLLNSILFLGLVGCGASDPGTGDPPVDPPKNLSSLTGQVWAPASGPGMVAVGQEIPVFNATVSLTQSKLDPIPQQTYCLDCIESSGFGTETDHGGRFTIRGVEAGTYWLTIEKAQFRLEQQITIEEGANVTLGAVETTLPSINDPANGKWTPKIALAAGDYDSIERILGNLGMGQVDSLTGDFIPTSIGGAFDVYSNAFFGDLESVAQGTLSDLVFDLNTMLQYHVILIPCSGSDNTDALQDPTVLNNIRQYVAAGGKLFVTDWSGEWADNVFPKPLQLEDGFGYTDTPANAYDEATNTWNTSLFGDADGDLYDSDDGEAVDDDLRQWLAEQTAPTPSGVVAAVDPQRMSIIDNWNKITSLQSIQKGVDSNGMPIMSDPKAWVAGSDGFGPKLPLTVTYEPTGCGRVLFSTYHTAPDSHIGLYPQERILVYLLMEIGICSNSVPVD